MDKAILKRLETLQQIADRNKPCKVVVTFADGSSATTDPAGAIDLFRGRGPFGDIVSFTPDRPEYDGLCGVLSVLCHPVPNREVRDLNNRVGVRITALAKAIERRKTEQTVPVDPLSLSLFEFRDWLTGLDETGKAELLEAMNNPDDGETDSLNLSMEDIEQMIAGWMG